MIAPWREAYRKFGAKPKDYPSSVENLTRRVLNGATMAHIHNLVALYNTISLRYILPVGGEDLDQIIGDVWLTQAGPDEPAIYLLGEKEARPPYAGEIIYKDDVGAICRRWNWKEADRTKLTQATRNAFFGDRSLTTGSSRHDRGGHWGTGGAGKRVLRRYSFHSGFRHR